jgi:putative thioredoxin
VNDAATASSHIFDTTQANFEADVIKASMTVPVLVDFWASWCGPCKTLGPLIEKVVAEFNGAVRLAKVDCDAEQALAGMFGVRSIPTVVLMRDGQPVDGFAGALPESELRDFLLRHVQPLAGEPEASAAEEIPETPEQANTRIQQELAANPDKSALKLDLAGALLRSGNVEAARAELDSLPANLATDTRATHLRDQLEFSSVLKDAPSSAELRARIGRDPADFAARDLLGVRLVLEGEEAAGLEQFLAILAADRHWNEGLAKRRLVAAFGLIRDAALVGTYRRRMSSLLF